MGAVPDERGSKQTNRAYRYRATSRLYRELPPVLIFSHREERPAV
jgi:hypothetical protein